MQKGTIYKGVRWSGSLQNRRISGAESETWYKSAERDHEREARNQRNTLDLVTYQTNILEREFLITYYRQNWAKEKLTEEGES